MSALYGRLQGSRGEVTRLGHQTIESTLETWTGEIRTELERDGSFSVLSARRTARLSECW